MGDMGANLATFFFTGGNGRDPVPPEDPLQGISANLRWQNAWMAAIALAWASEEDKQALLSDAPTFFKTRCQWEVPSGMDLSVTDKPATDGDGHPTGWYPDGFRGQPEQAGWHLAKTKVVMYLPPRPALEQQAVALANYLATGRTYPFTTC